MAERKSKKMKILAAGDIHGDTRLANELAKRAKKENVDLVILCGDLTFADSKKKKNSYIVKLDGISMYVLCIFIV